MVGPTGPISQLFVIGHFTVMCSVTWPLGRSEAGVDLGFHKPHCFSHVNHVVVMLTSLYLHEKDREACFYSKARSLNIQL